MKIQLSQSQVLLELKALKEQQEEILAQLEINRRRRRKRSEVKQPDPLQGPLGTDENVLLPGHAHPAHIKSTDIHSDLQGSVSLRANQTFFEEQSHDDPAKGGDKQKQFASQGQPTSKQTSINTNPSEVDVARAHYTSHGTQGLHPPKSMMASNQPPVGDVSSPAAPKNGSQSSGDKGCRAKQRQEKALASFRAYASNGTTSTAPEKTAEAGKMSQLASSTSIAANSTQLPPSVPHFGHEEKQGGLSKGAVAGIVLAIILLIVSIPIVLSIVRRRRQQRKRKLSAMFDKGVRVGPPILSYNPVGVPSAPNLHHDHHDISHTEIDELMSRVASVQAPKPARQSKKF
ncbi:hypothetical protein PGT21_028590 [Puccinia graminis f. sp. tritici]|uniref:Uncharacterized protein n=1 Tax=Puccinia graminis f. sp. tritici TaxID=56615 RepID=A0A5B0NLS2_PUCGR|nr:hypothetical protein PGT21_028590 [Puccinia graminis f. sp. tritici]